MGSNFVDAGVPLHPEAVLKWDGVRDTLCIKPAYYAYFQSLYIHVPGPSDENLEPDTRSSLHNFKFYA